MKHPILYRMAIYGIIGGLCACIMLLVSTMNEAPFTSRNMRTAYYNGCNFGGPRPLTIEHANNCEHYANLFKETLDDLDKQMEKLNE